MKRTSRLNWTGDAEETLVVGESPSGPELTARTSCEVWVPAGVPVTVRQARGNAKVREIEAAFKAEQVGGDLKLSDMGEVVIDMAHGNLKANDLSSLKVDFVGGNASVKSVERAELKAVQGNLQAKALGRLHLASVAGELVVKDVEGPVDAERVDGNAVLKDIGGLVSIDKVAGNLVGRDLLGGVKAGGIGGNLMLGGDLGSGCTYQFRAGGNALLKLADDANASVTLKAGSRVVSGVTLIDEERTANSLRGTLGRRRHRADRRGGRQRHAGSPRAHVVARGRGRAVGGGRRRARTGRLLVGRHDLSPGGGQPAGHRRGRDQPPGQ